MNENNQAASRPKILAHRECRIGPVQCGPRTISLVVPCYNEEEMLPITISELYGFLSECVAEGLAGADSEIILVDDGSRDRTWELISRAAEEHSAIRGLKLSRNRGHQNALLAGLEKAEGDFIISLDADLQDDINVIKDMIRAAENGMDIALGVRKKRETDSPFKRLSAEGFYKLMSFLKVNLVYNHADFRGLSRRAVAALMEYKEVNLFLRGIIPELGFPTVLIYYDRKERAAGETKYPLRKMLSFAWQGVTSFSTFPLKFVSFLGLLMATGSLAVVAWALSVHFFTDNAIPGWTSTVVPLLFTSGVQLLGLGIIGEYLGKMYLETKRRPRYFIEKTTDDESRTKP
ncbi:glycosyltransferase [Deltaproteobacteria bacterium Smac51]|nr:glycosyltransferase [Deltaproteobacteria bacterium Smac51]